MPTQSSERLTRNQNNLILPRMDTIYIGYDWREHQAVRVLIDSIYRHASRPINVVTLNQNALRRAGLYRRTPALNSTCWGSEQTGDMRDAFDLKPFSTDFSYSRFLIPMLNQYEGYALFMDCDMYFRSDPCELFDTFGTSDGPALRCVQHNYVGGDGVKMYGCPQTSYARKNWSSFMLFNCAHSAHHNLTVDDVNTKDGSWLHRMQWLKDEDLGDLPEEWNWLDGHSPEDLEAKNVHFTTGGPWFETWKPKRPQDEYYAQEWIHLTEDQIYEACTS